ncbi:ABC transporter permease [Corticibacterium sp. UT-5YL-CI-8]|nr:ABC transporter permease [Tianweitania sp. UT-5YL-CI-8]
MADTVADGASQRRLSWPVQLDKLGVVIAVLTGWGLLLAPFATMRANRIVAGEAMGVVASLPVWAAALLLAAILTATIIAIPRTPTALRFLAGLVALAVLAILIGVAGGHLTPDGNTYARVSPAYGFWLLLFAFALLTTDAMARLKLGPVARIGMLGLTTLAIGLLLVSGQWDTLSIMKEYSSRAETFSTELIRHLLLAFGSLAAAVVVGLPLGIAAHRIARIRAPVLNVLNIIQTVPSIALFGILIAPLAWIAANVPGASAIGIRGIGAAPAFVALFLYSLLPVVANTVVGLAGVPRQANDAARGMGMTDGQRLAKVEFPLAFPVILTGIRIVLVQNIGMATIAALIGGGGLGVFVFQGIGQTAMDLVLLGALPTVAMAFAAAVVLDAIIEMTERRGR